MGFLKKSFGISLMLLIGINVFAGNITLKIKNTGGSTILYDVDNTSEVRYNISKGNGILLPGKEVEIKHQLNHGIPGSFKLVFLSEDYQNKMYCTVDWAKFNRLNIDTSVMWWCDMSILEKSPQAPWPQTCGAYIYAPRGSRLEGRLPMTNLYDGNYYAEIPVYLR